VRKKEIVMRMLHAVLLGIVAGVALAPAAMAADLGGAPRGSIKDAPPPYVPEFTWSGLYIGAHVGHGWSDLDWSAAGVTSEDGGRGWLGGVQMGYNWQRGVDGTTGCPNPAFDCSHSVNWVGSVRGRLGVTGNANRTLFYATAGGAWADMDYKSNFGGPGFSDRQFGWVAGGGIEHMLSPNMSARVEYLYYGFDGVTAPAGTISAGPTGLDPSIQTVRFGLNFKF
jgi:outer membrane immunogenic protein